ncbi:MAG: hypothetical protein MJ180_03180 [Candidatus Gastranaerophilales bacterium]|nr:hypothetical protein [Candidatus Gastranaerophilales bacterium]
MAVSQLEFEFVKDLPKAAASSGFWSKVKGAGDFIIGAWARPVGMEYRYCKNVLKEPISIFEAYNKYTAKALSNPKAIDVAGYAKEAAKNAGGAIAEGAKKTFMSKVGSLFAKFAIPVMCFIGPTINAFKELQNGGGIVGAVKEFAKGSIGLLGFSAGSLFATAVLGIAGTGFWPAAGVMAIGMLGSIAFDFLGKAILGKSTEEKLADAREQRRNNPQQLAFGGYSNLYEQRKQQLSGNYFGCYNQYMRPVNPSEVLSKAESSFRYAQNLYNTRSDYLFA